MTIIKYRVRFYYDEDAISSSMISRAAERAYDCFHGEQSADGSEVEITFTIFKMNEDGPLPDTNSKDLINILFIGARDNYDEVLNRSMSVAIVPNIMFATKRNFDLHRRQSLMSIAGQSDSHLQFYDDFESEVFLGDLINIMLSISSAYQKEIYGVTDELTATSQQLAQAAIQLDFAISAIEDLRLNTTYDIVSSLKQVSDVVKLRASVPDNHQQSDLEKIFGQIITLSAQLLDAMENKKFAGLAVCGIVGSVIGWIGTPAITATALCMAYAQGPETLKVFLAEVVARVGFGNPNKDPTSTPEPPPRARRRRRVAK